MKTYEQSTKKELIKFIKKIRPKADLYDRICQQLGIKNNVLGRIQVIKQPEQTNAKEIK